MNTDEPVAADKGMANLAEESSPLAGALIAVADCSQGGIIFQWTAWNVD